MDIVSYILSTTFTKKSLKGMGALKGAPAMISSIVDNPDGTHDITFSWKDNSDATHTSVLTVANGETPTITSTEITGGHRLTFTTTDPTQSISFDVMDGVEGQRGVSVIRADVDNNNYLKLELSDGNVINAGQIKTVSMVDTELSTSSTNPVQNRVITTELNKKVNKVSGKQLSTEDFTTAEKNKLTNIENGAQVNTLENLIINGEEATIVDKKIALNIITSAVSNLQNYYLKSETYTKTEVEELIGSTVGVTIEIVEQLPTTGQTNVIYFVPTETTNVYSQYIYTSADGWVLIGSTSVDLSNYYTKGQVDTLLNGKQNVLTIDAFPTAMSNNPVASGGVYSAIAQMQPQFQFTNMPTADASNLGFVYQYIGNAGTYEPNMFYRCVYNSYAGEYRWEEVIFHATVTVDSELSSTSTNPVQNKVVKEALDTKQDIMQFTTMPSAQDNLGKIVQYTGATTATYQNACFYKAVYDSEHDVYVWNIVRFSADISVDNVLSDVSENPVQNKVITKKFDEYKTAFTGTEEEWDALTSEEQNVYDIMNITNDGDVLNLGVYLEKKTAMPVASEDVANRIYLYTGTTTQNYKKGVVYQCVSNGQTPTTYSWVALIDFGTAAIKNSTDRVLPNSTDLVESRSVYSAINNALSSIYTPRGDITCAELTSSLLISDNIGNVYEVSDSGTTTALFLQGAGHPIAVGDNVGIINAGQGRILFNLMANAFDLTDYQKKDLASTIEGATTVEGALGALSTNKADKVSSATNGNFAGLDASGNLNDSGKKADDFATAEELADEAKTRAKLGAHNFVALNRSTYKPQYAANLSSITDQTEDSVTVTSIAADYAGLRLYNKIAPGEYIVSYDFESDDTSYVPAVSLYYSNSEMIPNGGNILKNTQRKITVLDSYDYVEIRLFITRASDAVIRTGTFKNLMFRLATDTDATYQPYAKTNQELTQDSVTWTDYAKSGAVNVIPFDLAKAKAANILGTWSGNTYTVNNVTFAFNDDGTLVVNTSGATARTTFQYYEAVADVWLEKNRAYKASAFNDIVKDATQGFFIQLFRSGYPYPRIAMFNEQPFVVDNQYFGISNTLSVQIVVENGTVVTNQTIKPIISDAAYNGGHVPYAKTNKELTEDVDTINNNGFLQANSYCFYCSANSSAIDAYAQSLGITTSTTFSEVINILKNNIRYNATRFTVSTNDANLSSSASQLLKDLCGFFGITACAMLSFDVKVIDTYNQRVEIMLTDKNLNNIKIVRVTNGTAGTVKTIALS